MVRFTAQLRVCSSQEERNALTVALSAIGFVFVRIKLLSQVSSTDGPASKEEWMTQVDKESEEVGRDGSYSSSYTSTSTSSSSDSTS